MYKGLRKAFDNIMQILFREPGDGKVSSEKER